MELTIGLQRPDEREACYQLRAYAFGSSEPYDPSRPRIPDDRVMVGRRGGGVVGTVATIPFGHWFGGVRVSAGGVTGVAVAPDATGQGLAKRLLVDALRQMHELGEIVSSLYPTTATLYRSVGFEVTGWWTRRAVPTDALRSARLDGVTVEAVDWSRRDDVEAVYRAHARRSHGWLDRSDEFWSFNQYVAEHAKPPVRIYLAEDDDGPAGAALIRSVPAGDSGMLDLQAETLVGGSRGLRALAATFAGHGTTAGRLNTLLPAQELHQLTDQPQRTRIADGWPWMLRLVDAPAAFAARQLPALGAEIHFDVDDPILGHNHGPFVLRDTDDGVRLEPGGRGAVSIAVTDLAVLWSGFAAPITLAAGGQLPGATEADVTALTRSLASQAPTLVDFF